MKSVGDLLKEGRVRKNYSRIVLGEMTHIRTSFIAAIENGDWEKLPEFNVTLGFVKIISHFLEIDERHAVSLFRRDYPPRLNKIGTGKSQSENLMKKFIWGPRVTFLAGVIIIIFLVVGYLGFQYRKFNLPPGLVIQEPREGQVVTIRELQVVGRTDSDATVEVNNQPTVTHDGGRFDTLIEISDNTFEIKVVAKSRGGKETVVSRTIKPDL